MAYETHDDGLYWDDRRLAAQTDIVVDGAQQGAYIVRETKGVVVTRLPVGDYVMATPRAQIVVVEEKKPLDLASSFASRRLQRQLRQVVGAGHIWVLGLRGQPTALGTLYDEAVPKVVLEMVKWQMLGGYVVGLPERLQDVVLTLRELRAVLVPSSSTLSVLAGDDRGKIRQAMPPPARAIRRAVDGVGYAIAMALWERYKDAQSPLLAMLQAPDDEWRKVRGVNYRILKNRRAALGLPDSPPGNV